MLGDGVCLSEWEEHSNVRNRVKVLLLFGMTGENNVFVWSRIIPLVYFRVGSL